MRTLIMAVLILIVTMLAGCFESIDLLVLRNHLIEPPKLRMFYVDYEEPTSHLVACISDDVKDVQRLFADEMERHGYGRKTFKIVTDATGTLEVEWVKPLHEAAHYTNGVEIHNELIDRFRPNVSFPPQITDVDEIQLFFTTVELGKSCGIAAFPQSANIDGKVYRTSTGAAFVHHHCWDDIRKRDGEWQCDYLKVEFTQRAIAHELGHAFGLGHDWSNGEFIMSYGNTFIGEVDYGGPQIGDEWIPVKNPQSKFSPKAAAKFNSHPAFQLGVEVLK